MRALIKTKKKLIVNISHISMDILGIIQSFLVLCFFYMLWDIAANATKPQYFQ
jgi:hypothetical protein